MLAIATPKQRYAFDKIVTAVYCDEGGFFFVYGHGGTGKIFLWNLMSIEICSRGDIVLNVTSSAMLLLKAKLIIWDEAPMVSRYYYEALDKCLGDIMKCSPTYKKDLPFGEKVVVLGGDFRQILPVILRGSRQRYRSFNREFVLSLEVLSSAQTNKKHGLSVGMTASDQDETEQFGEWLLKVGDGLIGDNMDGESEICLPGDIVIPSLD
ncbi:uncharacterized protein LOC107475061 [Arachis duranensis]|uniref:ATP-dependent DNA helicase n=1 Tax=Arachis duranensis TaxID=130453 RepID=A0A6P4CF55_ARADU|nr:uncharacterized protein LOC107475061 [Arachis duranensis]